MKPPLNWSLFASKVALTLLALGLDVAGKLSPQGAAILTALVLALGGTHIAQLLNAFPPDSSARLDRIANVIVSGIAALVPKVADSPAVGLVVTSPPTTAATAAKALVFLLVVAGGARSLCACTPAHSAQEDLDVGLYENEQLACVNTNSSRESIDACRAASRARFCGRYPSAINCGGDAS